MFLLNYRVPLPCGRCNILPTRGLLSGFETRQCKTEIPSYSGFSIPSVVNIVVLITGPIVKVVVMFIAVETLGVIIVLTPRL